CCGSTIFAPHEERGAPCVESLVRGTGGLRQARAVALDRAARLPEIEPQPPGGCAERIDQAFCVRRELLMRETGEVGAVEGLQLPAQGCPLRRSSERATHVRPRAERLTDSQQLARWHRVRTLRAACAFDRGIRHEIEVRRLIERRTQRL